MAASDLAGGRKVSVFPAPPEITMFLLAKEFGWTPYQIKNSESKDIKAITTILSAYNRVKNQNIDKQNKSIKKRR